MNRGNGHNGLLNGNGQLNGSSENGKQNGEQVKGRIKTPFTFSLLSELPIGQDGVISPNTILRKHNVVFINKDAVVSPPAYYNAGLVKIKRLKPGTGVESFALEAKYVTIMPFVQRKQQLPDWWIRLSGYVGPIALQMEHIRPDNWWHTFDVEDLIGMLINVCHKREIPDWYDVVKAQVIERVTHKSVLRFSDIPNLLKQVSGITSLEDVSQALQGALRNDLKRYEKLFSDDTVQEMLMGLHELPEQRQFVRELQSKATNGKSAIGFTFGNNGNGQ